MSVGLGKPYRPSNRIHIRSVLAMLGAGLAVAALGAGPIWLWEISPMPKLMFITPFLQGAIVGFVILLVIQRQHLHSPMIAGPLGFAIGLLSFGLVHYGHYLRLVNRVGLARIAAATGYDGFVGSMILRSQIGMRLFPHVGATEADLITGWGLGLFWAIEALVVAGPAASLAWVSAAVPYCDDCRRWYMKLPNALVMGGNIAVPLAQAVQIDDPKRVAELRARGDNAGLGRVCVTIHCCKGCGRALADVSHHVRRGRSIEKSYLLKKVGISPTMALTIMPPRGGALRR